MATLKKRTWTKSGGKKQTAWVVGYQDKAGKRIMIPFIDRYKSIS